MCVSQSSFSYSSFDAASLYFLLDMHMSVLLFRFCTRFSTDMCSLSLSSLELTPGIYGEHFHSFLGCEPMCSVDL